MTRYLDTDSPGPDVLLEMLGHTTKPIAFMIGSALSLPAKRGAPGVPGVSGVIDLVKRAAADKHHLNVDELNRKLDNVQPAAQYTTAIKFLLDRVSQDAVNDVVRQAVRLARKDPASDEASSDEDLERDYDGWVVPAGGQALAELAVRFPEKYRGPIVTTNFDPLIKIAIQQKGGISHSTVLDADGRLPKSDIESPDQHDIVYLHGYWRGSDTLHTPVQLQMDRPYLTASLQRLLRHQMMVVVGYGGWDDVFTKALSSAVFDLPDLDIVWAFHEREPALIEQHYEKLFNSVRNAIGSGRFRSYVGIDCNALFRDLLAYETETASKAASSALDEPSVQPVAEPSPTAAQGRPRLRSAEASASGRLPDQVLTAFVRGAEELGRVVAAFDGQAGLFDRSVYEIRSLIVNIYKVTTESMFGPGGIIQYEFRVRDGFKKSYNKVDDAIDVYEYVLERFERAQLAGRATMQEREELVNARRMAIVFLDEFSAMISSIVEIVTES